MTKPLFDVFRDAVMWKPAGSRKEAMDWFLKQMKAKPEYLEELARFYFERMSATWSAREGEHGHSFGRTVAAENMIAQRRKQRQENAARSATMLETLKTSIRNVILLDLVMPNGKALRHATGAECARAGGFYAEIGKRLKPTQVVDKHMSEANLQDIRARYFQRNDAKAA